MPKVKQWQSQDLNDNLSQRLYSFYCSFGQDFVLGLMRLCK